MTRMVVMGAGPMGLAAAYRATQLGYDVDLVEADSKVGGMAAHFDFGGLSIERFYHFICESDASTFALLNELGIRDKMRWTETSMGYYIGGQVYKWGDPIALLRFPYLTWTEKVRTGWQMFKAMKASNFEHIENLTAREWIERGSGPSVYRKLWQRLNDLKFHEYADRVSASWFATRIKRVGNSRKSLFREQLGYIEGGSETLMEALADAIRGNGGRIHLQTPVEQVLVTDGSVTGVRAGNQEFPADRVVSTVPIPFVTRLVPDLPEDWKQTYDAIDNIGVVCVVFKLRKTVSRYFWLNIVDPEFDIPGMIEFSNLRPLENTVVYVPFYMPTTNPKWKWSDERFIEQSFHCIKSINPELSDSDRIDARVGRLRYAQPVCEPNFQAKLPPIQTPIQGLQIADTSYYYPEDRGVGESVKLGWEMVDAASA